jgi:tRNA A37 threonylcarbamoyladenosine modification protein TsaB
MRAGLAIAKGAAAYLKVPLIPVTNFDLLFRRVIPVAEATDYCLLVPAKLPEYYYSLRTFEPEISAGTVDLENLGSIIGEKTAIVSDFCNESIQKHCYFAYLSGKDLKPEADSMLSLAQENFSAGRLVSPEKVEPLYMKDFVIKKHN